MTLRNRHIWLTALSLPFLVASACDGQTADPTPVLPPPAPLEPGPACLVSSAESLDFGVVLAGNQQTAFVTVAGCDAEPVMVTGLGVPDDGDMLLQARVYRPDGTTITPLLPYALQPDEDLVVAVSYRARASARDHGVVRTLRFAADSREVPELPGRFEVGLMGQPVTACPDDACGGPPDMQIGWPVQPASTVYRGNDTDTSHPIDNRRPVD
jgi:hypothetical protein